MTCGGSNPIRSRARTMPTFTHDQVSVVVVSRLFGFSDPTELAARWRLILADPEAAALARTIEARVRHLVEHADDPRRHFERLTGRPFPSTDSHD